MPEWTKRDRVFVISILLVATALLLARLDDRFLWQDEAETALLAESVLREGFPTAYDGRNLISQEEQQEFTAPDYRWFWTPWLQHYVTAASFAILGPSTWSARIPFVLFGAFGLLLCYALAVEISKRRETGIWAMLLLATSVPYLLHARQCRYYALACFFGMLFLWQYLRIQRGGRYAPIGLVVAATGLFHSHYVVFAGFVVGVGIHFLLCGGFRSERRVVLVRVVTAALVTVAMAVPFIVGFLARSSAQALPGARRSLATLSDALAHIDLFVFPLVLLVVWLGLWVFDRMSPAPNDSPEESTSESPLSDSSLAPPHPLLSLVLVFVCTTLALSVVMPWFFFRYYVALIPLAAILAANLVVEMRLHSQILGLCLGFLLVATNLPNGIWPIEPRVPEKSVRHFRTGDEQPGDVLGDWARFIPMAGYVYEIAHERTGPVEEAVRILKEQARPDDRIIATYGDLPLQFYTDLQVLGGLSGQDPSPFADAEWLFVRAHTHRRGDARLKRFISQNFSREAFEIIRLPALDVPYENRPDPIYHKIREVSEGLPAARLWKRRAHKDSFAPSGEEVGEAGA